MTGRPFCAAVALILACQFFFFSATAVAQIAPTTTASISGSVSDSTGKPVGNATVTLSGPKSASTKTDSQGLFVFVGVPFGTYTISAVATGLGLVSRSGVVVQGDTNVAIQYLSTTASGLRVIANVTSSARFNITPASITQVDPRANAFQGKTGWRSILEQIPGVAQAGFSAGVTGGAVTPGNPLVPVQISINGALPYETAILLDGMPLYGGSYSSQTLAGAGTDLGLYPLNGFAAADVVRGPGAGSPSIVDSIGGSFVLHSSGAVDRSRSILSLSNDLYGGFVANALTAARFKNLSITASYGVNNSPGPFHSGVIPWETIFNPTAINGMPFSCTGQCAHTHPANPNYAAVSNGSLAMSQSGLLVCCPNADTSWSQHSGSISLNYNISPSVTANVFYVGQTSNINANLASFTVNFTPPAGYAGAIPAGLQVLPQQGEWLSPFPFQQTANLVKEEITARIGGGLLRAAALQNRVSSIVGVAYPTSATLQLFGGGTLGGVPTVFNGGLYNLTFPSFNETIFQKSYNRDLLLSYAAPLGNALRAGASFVQSYYDIPQQIFVNSAISSSTPPDVSQTTNEMRVFVGGDPWPKTSVDLSWYFVNANYHTANPVGYSGVTGLSTNGWLDSASHYTAPRLGLVWRPTASLAVRAAAGGGFALAPLTDLVGSSGTPNCTGGFQCTLVKPNLNVQPERSFGFDVGADLNFSRGTVLSLDLYRATLDGQVYKSTTQQGTFMSLPLEVTQFANLGESRYEGLLFDLRHDVAQGPYWALSGGLTRGYVVNLPAGFYNAAGGVCNTTTNTNCANQNVVPGINFNNTFTAVSVPYAQGLGKVGYRWEAQKYLDLVATYYGNNNTYLRPAFIELDSHASLPLSTNVSLLLTFSNITGIYDGEVQVFSPGSTMGVPAISGPPYAEFGEMYGPRAIIVTTQFQI